MRWILLLPFVLLAACGPVVVAPRDPGPGSADRLSDAELRGIADRSARRFVSVVERVEPVAEAECRARLPRGDCDFQIVVDDRPGQPPNAFQTVDRSGRPILAFTLSLIVDVRNDDELAFIMGHEAAHHIEGHIPKTQESAAIGATILSGIVAIGGGNAGAVRQAQQIGATVGARRFSKDFEIEADVLGTIIADRAGYDPVRGSAYFQRIPDPGDRFLGTHPPNADRIAAVRRTAQGL